MKRKTGLILALGTLMCVAGGWVGYRRIYPYEFIRTFGGVEIPPEECPTEACSGAPDGKDTSRYWIFNVSYRDLSETVVSQVGQPMAVSKGTRAGCSPFGTGGTSAVLCQMKNQSGKGPQCVFELMR